MPVANDLQDPGSQRLENELRESHAQLRQHITHTPLAAIEWDSEYRVTSFSRGAEEMFGWSASEMVGKCIDEVPWVPEEAWPSIRAVMQDMASGARPSNVNANANVRKDGSTIHCEWYNSAINGPDGRLLSVLSLVLDVTGREQALAALNESQARLGLFVEHAPAAIAMFDREMRYLAVSRRWISDYRLGHGDILGRSHYEVFPDLPERWRAVHQRCLGGAVEKCEEDPFPRAEGGTDWVRWEIHPWRTASGEVGGLVMFTEVVTERVALQARLAVASRLAAMGTLVTGVAHEINNPLAAELANQGLALEVVREVQRRLAGSEPIDREAEGRLLGEAIEALEDAAKGGQRVAGIVRDLTTFGNPDQARKRVRLLDVVAQATRWLNPAIGKTATVEVEDLGAPDIVAAGGQIEQVVVNLVTNAARATPPGERGNITIRVGPGATGMARLEVVDRGTGIDPAVLGRIFEPFFTTRPSGAGKGTGLGLSVCHAIASAHGGTLTVESAPGKGSTFRMELPAAP